MADLLKMKHGTRPSGIAEYLIKAVDWSEKHTTPNFVRCASKKLKGDKSLIFTRNQTGR
jgi:hypothetical protein